MVCKRMDDKHYNTLLVRITCQILLRREVINDQKVLEVEKPTIASEDTTADVHQAAGTCQDRGGAMTIGNFLGPGPS
jgi:hypothetical protein